MKRKSTGRKRKRNIQCINPNAAGIDCGSDAHYVAVAPDRCEEPVRRFRAFTTDIYQLADWLSECDIETVAIESTGVYWFPLYEILEARGFDVVLVNARHVKNVPGRKTDVQDCQWLQELHSFGLLRGSFRPSADIVALRTYMRHREKLVQNAGDHVRRMQKTLVEMNLQLHTVLSDITGLTGMRILRDIVAGQTDPKALAAHRNGRCHATTEEIEASLTGHYRPEQIFVLRQHLELYDTYQEKVQACDQELEALLMQLASTKMQPERDLPAPRKRERKRGNAPDFEVRGLLHRITDADLTQIDSIGSHTALSIVSEIGTDMNRWPSEKHFTSWLTLSPANKISGDRVLSSRTRPSKNRVAALLRLCAVSVGKTDTALGAYYRRLAYRIGKAKAVTATARTLAILVYRVLKGDFVYDDPGSDAYNTEHRNRTIKSLRKRAEQLGFNLVDVDTREVYQPNVS